MTEEKKSPFPLDDDQENGAPVETGDMELLGMSPDAVDPVHNSQAMMLTAASDAGL